MLSAALLLFGAILKFVAGVPYHLKVRTGFATSLHATLGKVALGSESGDDGECVDAFDLPTRTGSGPWLEIDRTSTPATATR